MKIFLIAAAAIVAGSVAVPACAETTASVGYSSFKFDKAQFDAITGRVDWRSGWFGVEGELSTGVADSNHGVNGLNVNAKLRDQASIYATATYPVADNMDLFARVGYGTTKIKASSPTAGLSGSDESWNIGAGGEWFFSGANGLRAEYTRQSFNDFSSDANVWSLSAVHKF